MTDPSRTVAARVLTRAGIPHRLHQHPPIRTHADLHLTGLDVATSAKTLAFRLPEGRVVLAALPGTGRLRYGDLARALDVPRSALAPATLEELSARGMEPGGVTPICDHPGTTLVVDRALLVHDVLYCGSGSPLVSVELATADLLRLFPEARVADLTAAL